MKNIKTYVNIETTRENIGARSNKEIKLVGEEQNISMFLLNMITNRLVKLGLSK